MCRHIHDSIGGRLPKPLLKVYSPNSTIHSYNTRQRNYPHTASRQNIIIAKQITHQGIGIWSRQSQNIQNIAPRHSFKRKLKQYIICLYWWKYHLIAGSGNGWLSMTRCINTYLSVHYTLWLFKINGYIFVIAVLVCMSMYVCVSVLVCLYAMILCCLWGCVLTMASMGITAKFQHTSLHLIL